MPDYPVVTVKELIEHLSKFPMDARVTIDMCSECNNLILDQVYLVRAEDRKLIIHRDHYITWDDKYKKPTDPEPEFVTAVKFPGN